MGYAEFERLANDRVEELLEAYAEARLDPTSRTLARIRGNLVARAATAAADRAELDTPTLQRVRPRFAWLQAPVARRAFALGLAATMTLGTSAAVLGAAPGSPFYNARLVIEAALLPTQIDARLAAYEEHLIARVREAEAAAAAGDGAALAAALGAYESDVAAAFMAAGENPDLLARLEAMLAKHTGILAGLEERVPEQASIDKAIAASEKAIVKIREKAAAADGRNGGAGGDGGNGGNGGTGANGGTGGTGANGGGPPSAGSEGAPDDGPDVPDGPPHEVGQP